MEGIDGNKMDIDGDDLPVSDNNKMEHEDQSTEQIQQKIKLSEMPVEILEKILIYLDDAHLLAASHVCKFFASVAETAFAQKYAKKLYKINGRSKREQSFHKIMLSKYGGKMRKLQINSCRDENLIDLVEQKCINLESIHCRDIPKLIILTGLKKISLKRIQNMSREKFTELIDKNDQLESLVIRDCEHDLIDILDGRNILKNLEYSRKTKLSSKLSQIRLNSLETLTLGLSADSRAVRDCARLLRAIKCDQLKVLELEDFYWNFDGVINEICSFKMLVTLRLPWISLTVNQHVTQLAHHLPHVTEFSMQIDLDEDNLENSIFSVLAIFPKLKNFTITLEEEHFDQFLSHIEKSIYSFYGRFANSNINTEIRITDDIQSICISNDRLIVHSSDSLEIHWMDNLNEKNMRKVINDGQKTAFEFKFINNCGQLDIATLIDENTDFSNINCIELKSIAPISINANTSRFFKSFPNVKSFRIDLEHRNAIDLLENLDANFCKQIEFLWINTKNVGEDPELKRRSDMANILAKFENLAYFAAYNRQKCQ